MPPRISDQEIDAAVDAVLADLATDAYPLAKGWTLDLVETVRTNTRAAEALTTTRQPRSATWRQSKSSWCIR